MGKFAHMTLPWTDIPIFLNVARGGSLSAAARTLKLDRTTVSRRLDNLERNMAEILFDRADGNFVLTKYGRQVFAAAENAEQELMILEKQPQNALYKGGKLRVSMSEHLLLTLADCLKTFALEHSDILLELSVTDRSVDLQHLEADVILRITKGALSKLDTRKIGKPLFSLYRRKDDTSAMQHYISRPHEKITPKYVKTLAADAKKILSVDGLVSMREMIAQGAGIGILPNYFGDLDQRIETCSEAMPSRNYALHIAYLPEKRRLPRLKIFADYVEQYLGQLSGFEARP